MFPSGSVHVENKSCPMVESLSFRFHNMNLFLLFSPFLVMHTKYQSQTFAQEILKTVGAEEHCSYNGAT